VSIGSGESTPATLPQHSIFRERHADDSLKTEQERQRGERLPSLALGQIPFDLGQSIATSF
jgi:hypothetical protein